jgi:hypothetical protein
MMKDRFDHDILIQIRIIAVCLLGLLLLEAPWFQGVRP